MLPLAVMPVLSVSVLNTVLAPLNAFDAMFTVCESTSRTPARVPQPVVGVSVTLFELTSMLRTRLNSNALRRARKRLPRKT